MPNFFDVVNNINWPCFRCIYLFSAINWYLQLLCEDFSSLAASSSVSWSSRRPCPKPPPRPCSFGKPSCSPCCWGCAASCRCRPSPPRWSSSCPPEGCSGSGLVLVLAKVALSFCTPKCPEIQITNTTNPILNHLIIQDSHSVISHPALKEDIFVKDEKQWHLTPSM